MEFEWDEDKRQANIDKHRVDFRVARRLFDGRPTRTYLIDRPDETRFGTIAEMDGRIYVAIWTWREDRIRLISVRSARDAEKRAYREVLGGGA